MSIEDDTTRNFILLVYLLTLVSKKVQLTADRATRVNKTKTFILLLQN